MKSAKQISILVVLFMFHSTSTAQEQERTDIISQTVGQASGELTKPVDRPKHPEEYDSIRDYFDFEGFISFVSDYRWRGVSQTMLQPAVQGQGYVRTVKGFYGSIFGSYINFPDVRNKIINAELDFIVGNSKTFGKFGYDIGYLFNYYPGGVGENFGETFLNIEYSIFAAGMSYTPNVFDLRSSGFYIFGDLFPELPITLPFCKKGVTLLLHVGHYTFSGSFNRASYFDFKVGLAKTFVEHITLDLSFISTDGAFLVDQRDAGPTFVANLTITF